MQVEIWMPIAVVYFMRKLGIPLLPASTFLHGIHQNRNRVLKKFAPDVIPNRYRMLLPFGARVVSLPLRQAQGDKQYDSARRHEKWQS
jgi:hypothetical protein